MKNMNPSTTGNSAAVSFSELRMVLDSPKTQSHMHEMAHWHDELEGIYVLTGSMDFYLDDRKLTLSSGDFLLITSSAMHYSNLCIHCFFPFWKTETQNSCCCVQRRIRKT